MKIPRETWDSVSLLETPNKLRAPRPPAFLVSGFKCLLQAVEKASWTTLLLMVPQQTWLSQTPAYLELVWAGEMKATSWIQGSFLNVCTPLSVHQDARC